MAIEARPSDAAAPAVPACGPLVFDPRTVPPGLSRVEGTQWRRGDKSGVYAGAQARADAVEGDADGRGIRQAALAPESADPVGELTDRAFDNRRTTYQLGEAVVG